MLKTITGVNLNNDFILGHSNQLQQKFIIFIFVAEDS